MGQGRYGSSPARVLKELAGSRPLVTDLAVPSTSGIHSLFLKHPDSLPLELVETSAEALCVGSSKNLTGRHNIRHISARPV